MMKTKLAGAALFALTLTTIAVYPSFSTTKQFVEPGTGVTNHLTAPPVIDVVFVLDTTSSMTGLIQTAKEKIWSIATTMTSSQQTPSFRVGLVAFRDRGDQYVTRVIDLSDDLDSVYASLMDFKAEGGGDGPESVNQALYDAVHGISWSQNPRAYQAIFLVGDAPPHMDYQGEDQYPEILASAAKMGIVVNTIQCGDVVRTRKPWQKIASLGSGQFFQVGQAGSAVAIDTPYDEEIASLSAKLDSTRRYYGSADEKAKMQSKVEATEKLNKHASLATRARRGAFNSSAAGRKNLLGEKELIDAVTSGAVELNEIDKKSLPAALQSLGKSEQMAEIKKLAGQRSDLEGQIEELTQSRSSYLSEKVEEAGDADDSLDNKLFDAVKQQAARFGLDYRGEPEY